MNYGLWMSTAGLSTEVHRQDVISNNIANAETTGFKADYAFTRERPIARTELGADVPAQELLERLGGGVLADRTWTDFAQGDLRSTGAPLDLALEGGGFFVVQDSDGDAFTRDGRFTRSHRGELVDLDGRAVMSTRGRTIRLPEGEISIDVAGTVLVDGEEIASLRLAAPATDTLRKVGGNLFKSSATDVPDATEVRVQQGMVEGSGVDAIGSLTDLIEAGRNVQAAARFIDFHDRMMELAVTRIGVSA